MNTPIYFSSKMTNYNWLSNFYNAPFILENKNWPSVEHWFQASKFPTNEELQEKIRLANTPSIAKRLGRTKTITFRTDWEEIKEAIMYQGLKGKFKQNQTLRDKLKETGAREIIEKSTWDSYWGSGKSGLGKNRLGILIMQVREELV